MNLTIDMSDSDFHLIDLVSQAVAVKSLLAGKSEQEKIDWLKSRGTLARAPSSIPFGPHSYAFESTTGIQCCFFIKGDEFYFIGDNTVFTVPNTNRKSAPAKPWWKVW